MPKEETKILTPYQMEVEKICSFKNTPQRVDLTQFVTAVEGIAAQRGGDVDELAQDLDERLQQKFPWQQRLNALSAVEAILRHNALPGHESFAEYFKENPEDVQRNVHVVQGSLKEKAQKVLKLLGVPERTSAQQESSAAPAQQLSVATGNGGISWASSAPVANQEAPPAAPAGDGADLLGGMTVKSRHSKSTEDKTKLRKRAAMTIADDEEPAPVAMAPPSSQPPQQKATDTSNNGWGNTWGDSANTTTQSNGAWGTFDSTPVVAQQQQQPAAAAAPKPKNDLDDFFSAPSSWAPPPIPQQSSGFATTPAPAPVAAAPVAQQQPLVNNATTQMVLQMQQQMQTMLSQINMADPNAMAQMQALMAQQQQLMALVAATSQQQQHQVVASQGDVSQNTPVVPHGHFSVPVQGRQVPVDDSFAAVQREMMSKMMGK